MRPTLHEDRHNWSAQVHYPGLRGPDSCNARFLVRKQFMVAVVDLKDSVREWEAYRVISKRSE